MSVTPAIASKATYLVSGLSSELTVEILSDDGENSVVRITRPGAEPRAYSFRSTDLGSSRYLVQDLPKTTVIDALRGEKASWTVLHGEDTFELTVRNERDTWLAHGASGAAGAQVTVAMPGKVVFVDAKVGDVVTRGQRLLVIEAMKMENDVKAPRDGVVKAIRCAVGDAVEAGTPLVELE
ncbi:MAG: hypothetical protein IV100_21700 [Myxococcales bacterium]|nr:hypothetical protein [Myxococcales bacterium]